MKVAYKTDVGRKRENNEDAFFVDEERMLFVLADGMGGHSAGEVASKLAVEEAYGYLKDKLDGADQEKKVNKLLLEAIFKAHEAIKAKARNDIALYGMGTTLLVLIIRDIKGYLCYVGDSRVYLIRDKIMQLTKDQTVGAYLVEHNVMRREEVPPEKWHTLTQAVGVSDIIVPEWKSIELRKDDLLLLCTDGLTDMVSDEEIHLIVRKQKRLIDATNALIRQANKNGGNDNITVILIKV